MSGVASIVAEDVLTKCVMVIQAIAALSKIRRCTDQIFKPIGLDALQKTTDYLVITIGRKAADAAVKRGIPCISLLNMSAWAKNPQPWQLLNEDADIHPDLIAVATGKKCLVLFGDANNSHGMSWRQAASILRDALLRQVVAWCRSESMPATPGPEQLSVTTMDELLSTEIGERVLREHIQSVLQRNSQWMRPLFKLPYQYSPDLNRYLHYLVLRNSKFDVSGRNRIVREVIRLELPLSDNPQYVTVANTRAWLSHIIPSSDGDNQVRYGVTYIPLSKEAPQTVYGDASILSLKAEPDILAEHGARIQSSHRRAMEEFFHDCQAYGPKAGVVISVPGTKARGWRAPDSICPDPIYVMPNRLITTRDELRPEDPKCPLIPIETEHDESAVRSMIAKGDREVWRHAIWKHVLHPAGLPAVMFAAGVSGLLRWCAPESENYILHTYGTSSAGKSLGLKAAASFWGHPVVGGMVDAWRTTDNGLERKAALRNDSALFLDESGMVTDESVISKAVYMLGNGSEKIRAKRDGGTRQTASYRLATISTGEKMLIANSKYTGQEVRALEIRCDVGGQFWHAIKSPAEAEQFESIINSNYGWGVVPLVQLIMRYIATDPLTISRAFTDHLAMLRQESVKRSTEKSLPTHVQRRTKHLALILLAYRLVLESFEIPVHVQDTSVSKLAHFILDHMIQVESDQFKDGEKVEIIRHFANRVSANLSRFIDEARDLRVPNAEIIGKITSDSVSIISTQIDALMDPWNRSRLLPLLKEISALIVDKQRNRNTHSMRFGSVRGECYHIDLERLNAWMASHDNDNE